MNSDIFEDTDLIFNELESLWKEISGKRFFFTGCTGFFGIWLLDTYITACEKLSLDSQATILTRNPEQFIKLYPRYSNVKNISFLKGDIRNFEFPEDEFSYFIHGATTNASETFNKQDPLIKFDTVFEGTRRVLDFASSSGCEKFLYISSGSVYGKQPESILKIEESYSGAPFTNDKNFDHSVLGESKRASELLTSIYAEKFDIQVKTARCFSFVGPYLPVDIHYAIGNFIRDVITEKPIVIKGDGSAERSYMYAADLTIWLWKILFLGENSEIYNVGSERTISIADLANMVSKLSPTKNEVIIRNKSDSGKLIDRYVPSTSKARNLLNLREFTDLEVAISKTIDHVSKNKSLYGLN